MARAAAAAEVDSLPVGKITAKSEPTQTRTPEFERAVAQLVTEDDTPVDNLFSEKQRQLLTGPLYHSWKGGAERRRFMALADVGVFRSVEEPPLAPDAFLSLDVTPPDDWWEKRHRSYFIWEYGKPPDVVIEVVSNVKGGETDAKMGRYARFGVPYYVILDPLEQVQQGMLRAYELSSGIYVERSPGLLPGTGLGLRLWHGEYDERIDTWLRWQEMSGELVLTGAERADQEKDRGDQAESRAEQAENRAEQAENRAEQAENLNEQLIALLRAHGIDPDDGERTQ